MKDKQIKYLLTLKRKFESIRRDQYVFSERNPLPACSANSPPSISQANTVSMQKLYQTINYTLQSIEFKILDTVTEQQRKPNNTRETQQSAIQQNKRNQTLEATSKKDDQDVSSSINNNNDNKNQFQKAHPIMKEQSITAVKPVQSHFNIFKPKCSPSSSSSQLQLKQISQTLKGPIEEEGFEPKFYMNERVLTANCGQNSQIVVQPYYPNERLTIAKQCPPNLFENQQLFYQHSTPQSPQLNSKKIEIEFASNTYQSVDKMNSMNADESDIQSIDGYLNFETPKKNIFRDDESDPVMMYENINEILINRFYAQNNIDILPNIQANVKQEITGIVTEEEEEDQCQALNNLLLGPCESERISILKEFNSTPTCFINKSKDTQNLFTMKKAQNAGTACKDESGATAKYLSKESERSQKKFLQTEKRMKIDIVPVIHRSDDDDASDQEEEEDDNPDEGIEEIEQDENDEVQEQYVQFEFSENRNCPREYDSIGKKQIAKKLDFKPREDDYKSYVRGPYNFYSEELKMKAIRDYFKFSDIKRAAEINEVKVKNLKRWITVGHKRKEGGGRKKEDPEMEELVFEWLKERYVKHHLPATRNEIREKALEFSNKKEKFKASKGWLEKFFSRYDCKHMSKKDTFHSSLNE